MALHWQPVGPESAETYWRRRAAVALAVLVALVLLVLLLTSLGGGDDEDQLVGAPQQTAGVSPAPTPSPGAGVDASATSGPSASPGATPGPSGTSGPSAGPSATATPSGTATPSATASPTPGAACTDEVLRVEAAATEQTYAVGATPRLELRVTNTGTTPCSRDLGQAAVELQVVSGPDRIWSSDDCAPGGDADVVTLQPGTPQVSTVTWSGTRSRPGCPEGGEKATAGTYRVDGRVGGLREQGERFVLR